MLSKDIPEMSTLAQRVGAYQSRRDQMIRADTGLRGWLVKVQHSIPATVAQRIAIIMTLLIVAPPKIKRLSRESHGPPASPSTTASSFASSGKVGRTVISKMKIGGKRLGTATKNAWAVSPVDERGSKEIHYSRQNGEAVRPPLPQRSSPEDRSEVRTPFVSRSDGPSQAECRQSVEENPDHIRISQDFPHDPQPVGLGLS